MAIGSNECKGIGSPAAADSPDEKEWHEVIVKQVPHPNGEG
jgi:hypothetical protein